MIPVLQPLTPVFRAGGRGTIARVKKTSEYAFFADWCLRVSLGESSGGPASRLVATAPSLESPTSAGVLAGVLAGPDPRLNRHPGRLQGPTMRSTTPMWAPMTSSLIQCFMMVCVWARCSVVVPIFLDEAV